MLRLLAAVAPADSVRSYRLLVTAESDDQVALVEFIPCRAQSRPGCGARVVRTYAVGVHPVDIEGPHGVIAALDGKSFFVTIAHGKPNGWLLQYDLASGDLLGQVGLGMFPATVDLDPAGQLLYAINFNFNDPEMKPSSLSVVHAGTMTEIARIPTCRMPHGSRLDPKGRRHYSGCMMDDLLVEVDAARREVSRLFSLAPGKEGPVPLPTVAAGGSRAPMGTTSHGEHTARTPSNVCSPTWAQPSADGQRVYVACNRSNEIVEIDVASWTMTRRWKTPAAPYNLAATPDGKLLLATQKGPGTITIWRLTDATLVADIPGTRKIASGIVVSPDSRYAFATLEGIGDDPGTVDVIDLEQHTKVATITVGRQAGGVAVLPQ
ncbi:MAG: YncE family protein [Gemmatimonadota bacterium]